MGVPKLASLGGFRRDPGQSGKHTGVRAGLARAEAVATANAGEPELLSAFIGDCLKPTVGPPAQKSRPCFRGRP